MKSLLCFFVILSQHCFAQNPKPFKTCNKTVDYTVDDWQLRKKVGMDLTIPVSNPSYIGGAEELKRFFKANSIDNSPYLFRTFIGFVVNCKGQLGNFQFIIDKKGDEQREQALEQVLDIAKKMPLKWKPAISKEGKPIDSYQIIALTIRGSDIIEVEYK
jgi:hypothetical protein